MVDFYHSTNLNLLAGIFHAMCLVIWNYDIIGHLSSIIASMSHTPAAPVICNTAINCAGYNLGGLPSCLPLSPHALRLRKPNVSFERLIRWSRDNTCTFVTAGQPGHTAPAILRVHPRNLRKLRALTNSYQLEFLEVTFVNYKTLFRNSSHNTF